VGGPTAAVRSTSGTVSSHPSKNVAVRRLALCLPRSASGEYGRFTQMAMTGPSRCALKSCQGAPTSVRFKATNLKPSMARLGQELPPAMGSLHVSRQPTWRRSCQAITYWRLGTGAYKQGLGLTMETRCAAEEVGGQHIGAVRPVLSQ
jgi:hypothetical protein